MHVHLINAGELDLITTLYVSLCRLTFWSKDEKNVNLIQNLLPINKKRKLETAS